jgi:hypothetical protein
VADSEKVSDGRRYGRADPDNRRESDAVGTAQDSAVDRRFDPSAETLVTEARVPHETTGGKLLLLAPSTAGTL